MVKQNGHKEVEAVTKKALAALPDLTTAMTHLTELKAVGPATASGGLLSLCNLPILAFWFFYAAIMCAAAPEIAPFMADEAVLGVPDLGKLEYTQKHYISYASKVQEKAKELNRLGTERSDVQ